jgi:hypothetical protein
VFHHYLDVERSGSEPRLESRGHDHPVQSAGQARTGVVIARPWRADPAHWKPPPPRAASQHAQIAFGIPSEPASRALTYVNPAVVPVAKKKVVRGIIFQAPVRAVSAVGPENRDDVTRAGTPERFHDAHLRQSVAFAGYGLTDEYRLARLKCLLRFRRPAFAPESRRDHDRERYDQAPRQSSKHRFISTPLPGRHSTRPPLDDLQREVDDHNGENTCCEAHQCEMLPFRPGSLPFRIHDELHRSASLTRLRGERQAMQRRGYPRGSWPPSDPRFSRAARVRNGNALARASARVASPTSAS